MLQGVEITINCKTCGQRTTSKIEDCVSAWIARCTHDNCRAVAFSFQKISRNELVNQNLNTEEEAI